MWQVPQFLVMASRVESFAAASTSWVLWQSEQIAAYALPSCSTALPCTEVAYCSRSLVWHFPHAFGTLKRHSVLSGLPFGKT